MSETTKPFDEETPQAVTAVAPGSASRVELSGRGEELFREMWASVFFSGKMTGQSLLVTSAARYEGATTIACGLALAGAGPAAGAHVALVDFNLRNPAVHETLGLRGTPGLAEALSNGGDMSNVAQRVNDSLDVYVAGQVADRSLKVLRSKAARSFFDALARAYDFVVVDIAAANIYPDAQVLGAIVQETLLVVNADVTPREAVGQAKKRIEGGGGRVCGMILNQRTYPIPSFLYRRV
jgi:polysaccharide biosynthesis transport protein